MPDYEVVVIGAGSAGVSTAALLQKEGYDTLLVERQEDVGGRSSTFEYRGYKVDTGSHQLASYSSSGMKDLFKYVGADVELSPVDPSLVHHDLESGEFVRATKKERFPNEEAYGDFKEVVKRTVAMDEEEIAQMHSISAVAWLDENVPNEDLKEFFKTITGFAGTPLEQVSAGAFFETLHDSFHSDQTIQYPTKGGIRNFSASILQAFKEHGGDVAFGVGVENIRVKEGRVIGVEGTKRRPGLNMQVDIGAERIVSTLPASMLFTIFPREAARPEFIEKIEQIREEAIVYGGAFAGVEHELFERRFGDSDLQYFQFSIEPTEELQAEVDEDWHAIATVPTYINPDQAPNGYDLVYLEIHVPVDRQNTARIREFQELAVEVMREMWPDFDERHDWCHPVVEPNVLVIPPRVGLTGENRPGFSMPGVEGMYMAGDGAYSSGSGIGSAVKSAWGAARAILHDDGREYTGPIEPYLALGE